MIIGVPRERHREEHRVGLTPYAAAQLHAQGHEVLIERGAGEDSHFRDPDYHEAGAQVVYRAEEIFGRAEMICRVGPLAMDEAELLRPGATVCGFLHVAVAPPELRALLQDRQIRTLSYELLERDGRRPVLRALSEIAGQLVIHKGQSLLEVNAGGRGVVLGAVPGVPPATVVVLGAGVAGRAAARTASACGAHVIVLDRDVDALRDVVTEGVVTLVSSPRNVSRCAAIADLLVGAVNVPGEPAPLLVPEAVVRRMKPGSVILDLSIDDGGCVETSRPTTLSDPTFVAHGVIHHCVPNLTAAVPRTASRAVSLAALPLLSAVAAGEAP